MIDEVVLAATTLAAQRTGAIIVIERDMGLRSYIETGIALDALVTYDLLISIFNPGTPLHDGAVIIQGNRIAAAACFLPLTVNPELSRQLGSRHRAAIGVTEDTDAVAVVVSEETGTISLVVRRAHPRDLDGRSLKQALLDLLEVRETGEADARRARPPPAPWRRARSRAVKLPIDNLALKRPAWGWPALLWFVIAGEKTSEMGLTVPVELQNFPRDLELTGEPVNAVEVRLRASPGHHPAHRARRRVGPRRPGWAWARASTSCT